MQSNKAMIISGLRIFIALATISLAAQTTIDIGPIPITGQTLMILIWAFFMSPSSSFVTLSLYIILGIIGLPIFANASHGISVLTGGSGGFIIGFLVAMTTVSVLHKKVISPSFWTILWLTAVGTGIILLSGVSWLTYNYGYTKGLEYGFYPFWKGALIKIVLGSTIVYALKKFDSQLSSTASN